MTKARGKAGGGFACKVAITGDKQIDKMLRDLEPKIAKKHVRKAIRKSLKPVLAKAKELAPVGEDVYRKGKPIRMGGETRAALRIVSSKGRRGVIRLSVMVGSGNFVDKTFYASFVELGTKRMPAKQFMRPALKEKQGEALAIFTAEMRKALEIETKGAA